MLYVLPFLFQMLNPAKKKTMEGFLTRNRFEFPASGGHKRRQTPVSVHRPQRNMSSKGRQQSSTPQLYLHLNRKPLQTPLCTPWHTGHQPAEGAEIISKIPPAGTAMRTE